MLLLRSFYIVNVAVTAWIGITCLFYPQKAVFSIFTNEMAYSESIRLVGALWMGICLMSILGIFFPFKMSIILLFQLLYKSTWLIFVAFPAFLRSQPYPSAMALFFLIWVVILPFVIPWSFLLGKS